jgi:hypothetical protein
MRQKSTPEKQPVEDAIKDIRRATRRCKVADRIGARRLEFFSALPANAFSLSHSEGVGPCARSRHIGLRRRG